MRAVSRRRFLQISTGAAGIAAAGAVPRFVDGAMPAPEALRTVPTICDVCFWKCGAIAHVRDGELWKIEGNPDDPLSEGRLCPRGTGGVGAHFDTNRLTSPLIRSRSRGEERWIESTWDEAFEYIAERMLRIRDEYGPEAMALFNHGMGGVFFRHMLRAYGSNNIAAPSFAQCRGPRDVGFMLTYGDVIGSPERTDIANTDCLVLIGSHLGENMHNTQAQEFARAVERGASIIVVDPRFSVAASKAKHYLAIKPGTDLALLLAWMNVIVGEGLYDREYVEAYGFGFEPFAAEIARYTPEWAFAKTGIEPGLIRTSAREMARYRPATLVHPGRHATWYGDDTQRSRAIALLNALLGSWGRKGGFYFPFGMEVPGYPYEVPYPTPQRPKVDNPDETYPFADEALTTGVRDATISGEPYPIKGWMVYASNLLQALPNRDDTIRAIQELDLLVVVDVIPSEIAGWADVVLPEAVYLERHDDLNVSYFREAFVSLRQPVVEAPANQKPGWWIARQLGLKLGLQEYFPWSDIEEYLRTRVEGAGLDFERLKQDGIIRAPRQPMYLEEGVPAEFYTPTGKIEFYSPQLAEAGFDPVPRYTDPEEPPPGAFRLLFGRAPVHSFGRTQTNPVLSSVMDENEVWINADVAHRYGLVSGATVRLRNQDGVLSNAVKVKATQRIRGDCVYMVHGFGHTARGIRPEYRKGASDADLCTAFRTDPIMGGTGMNVNFVTLEMEA